MIKYRSDVDVKLVDSMGNDLSVIKAAIVSTGGDIGKYEEFEAAYGLIKYLMKHRHGTPFESGVLQFVIDAPIFVWREFHRHRHLSYNEVSARYKQLEPVFWIPDRERPMVPSEKHTSARPDFVRLESDEQYEAVVAGMKYSYQENYQKYEAMLRLGVAKEVARCILPVGIYSQCYVTGNLRAFMNFLSLRVHDKDAMFVSYPQAEIQEAAVKMGMEFAAIFPLTHRAFVENRRVGP